MQLVLLADLFFDDLAGFFKASQFFFVESGCKRVAESLARRELLLLAEVDPVERLLAVLRKVLHLENLQSFLQTTKLLAFRKVIYKSN